MHRLFCTNDSYHTYHALHTTQHYARFTAAKCSLNELMLSQMNQQRTTLQFEYCCLILAHTIEAEYSIRSDHSIAMVDATYNSEELVAHEDETDSQYDLYDPAYSQTKT